MNVAFIEMAGFRGVKNVVRIDVPAGFLVIVGRNGSGKSTVCDAIEFVFTGMIREAGHKEKGESYADYLWWRGAGYADVHYVRLGFRDIQGGIHEVTRTRTGIDSASQAVLDCLYRQEGAPDRPLQALSRTSLIRDEEITGLSVDLPESERYRFVRDALGTIHVADVEKGLSTLKERIDERVQKEKRLYEHLRNKVSDTTARLSELRATLSSVGDYETVQQELRELLDLPEATSVKLLESARNTLSQARSRLDRLHFLVTGVREIATLQQTVGSRIYLDQQAGLELRVAEANKRVSDLKDECDHLAADLDLKRSHEPVRSKHAELCEIGESVGLVENEHCPLCGAIVSEQGFRDHIAAVRNQIQTAASGIVDLLSRQRHAHSALDVATHLLDDCRRKLGEHLALNGVLEKLIADNWREAASQGIPWARQPLNVEQIHSVIELVRERTSRLEEGTRSLELSSVTDMVQSLELELVQVKAQADESFSAAARSERASGKLKEAQRSMKSLVGEIIDEQLAELRGHPKTTSNQFYSQSCPDFKAW